MSSPHNTFCKLKNWIGKNGIIAFASTFIMGLLIHLVMMTYDIPNHDGLASMYSDQNMLTSGRWLLGLACSFSSYYTIPWLISILSLVYLGMASVFLCRILEADNSLAVILISGLLISFPSIASTFAYVFTMDGYMLGLLFSILAVYFVNKNRFGFVVGAIFLGCSMGIYQAYLPVAMLLSLYSVVLIFCGDNNISTKFNAALKYVYMGVIGAAFYYVVLKLMLVINHQSLASYQGIDQMVTNGSMSAADKIKAIYFDFVAFSLKGNILFANKLSFLATVILVLAFLWALVIRTIRREWYKSFWFYLVLLCLVLFVPVICNVILIISPGVTYHLLMRYQWVFLEIIAVAFINDVICEYGEAKAQSILSWAMLVATSVIIFSYAVTDNIAYTNLMKKYEKTYSYCLRLADRIEQTPGYYQGIPIYIIGVVGDDNYPVTDITDSVTGHMLGMNGDYLLYTGINYEQFYKNYMGITFNFLDPSEANFYYDDWYVDMPSFPAEGSVKVVNGILCIKTENSDRTGTE